MKWGAFCSLFISLCICLWLVSFPKYSSQYVVIKLPEIGSFGSHVLVGVNIQIIITHFHFQILLTAEHVARSVEFHAVTSEGSVRKEDKKLIKR